MPSEKQAARGYSVAFARDMIPEKMKSYSASLPPIYEKYQGKYLAIGGQGRGVDWLAGDWKDRMIMIGEFPTPEAVGAFWWGPEYRESAKLREGAVTVDVGQVPGTDLAPGESRSGHRASWTYPCHCRQQSPQTHAAESRAKCHESAL